MGTLVIIGISFAGGLLVGWQFPQPQWTKDAWSKFKNDWLK